MLPVSESASLGGSGLEATPYRIDAKQRAWVLIIKGLNGPQQETINWYLISLALPLNSGIVRLSTNRAYFSQGGVDHPSKR